MQVHKQATSINSSCMPGSSLIEKDLHARILVVDDEPEICELIQEYLADEGYAVSAANDGAGMRRVLQEKSTDLVILDLMLPGEDGLTLARQLRTESNVSIIMLTGRGDPSDRVIGLEMGADDYLAKPFHLRELLARVKSVLRRAQMRNAPPAAREQASFAGWRLEFATRELNSPKGEVVRLTTGEFDLLVAFVTNANRVLNRDRLLGLARNREAGPFDRTIDVQVGLLRRKLEPDPQNPTLIKTVRGVGYFFTPAVSLRQG
jgi:two-component system, OmpR family, response regulator